ncbi:MAG: hypothetical protein ISQ07_10395 [Pirellulales bacterium]|nr:hypothetical protein [Pirellulales bacterium]
MELYDLDEDRGETTNVAAEHRQLVEQMKSDLLSWHHSVPADAGDRLGREVEQRLREKQR